MRKIGMILVWTVFAGVVNGQNLVSNGTFDTDTTGWWAFSNIAWEAFDGANISGNGSMKNTGTVNNNAAFPAISDKFMVKSGYWYLSGVSYKLPADSVSPWAWYRIYWYDSMDNQIGISNQVAGEFDPPTDLWHDLTAMSQAPENAVMGELRIYFQSGEPGTVAMPYGLWDDVFVFEDTIFTNHFD